MRCKVCRRKIPTHAHFCRYCGTVVDGKNENVQSVTESARSDSHIVSTPENHRDNEHHTNATPQVTKRGRKRSYVFVSIIVLVLLTVSVALYALLGGLLFSRREQVTEVDRSLLHSGIVLPEVDDFPSHSGIKLPHESSSPEHTQAVDVKVHPSTALPATTPAPIVAKALDLTVKQVDVTSFPVIRLYMDIRDEHGVIPKDLSGGMFFLSEKRAHDPDYIKRSIKRVVQLDEQEQINIHLVADVSGSMMGTPIYDAISVMRRFLDHVQFGIGDMMQLTAFNSQVTEIQPFTKDKAALQYALNDLDAWGDTALFDALYFAIHHTALQEGAKCIIAFTDGEDNASSVSFETVIEDSKHFGIPIFIIGVDMDESYELSVLENICTQTGGSYHSIKEIDALESIYNHVYRAQKEQYLVEYTTESDKGKMSDQFDVQICLQTPAYTGEVDLSFEPHLLLDVDESYAAQDEIEMILASYLKGFVSAMRTNRFSDLSWTMIKDSPIYVEQKRFTQKDIDEELISYEILEKKIKGDQCTLLVRENYYIQSKRTALHMMTQIAHYRLFKTADGWRFHSFVEPVIVVQKIYQ